MKKTTKRNILFILLTLIVLKGVSWVFKSYGIDFYYKSKYEQQVSFLREFINLIADNNNSDRITQMIAKDSRLMEPEFRKLYPPLLNKVDLDTMLVNHVHIEQTSENLANCYMWVFFVGDKTSMTAAKLQRKGKEEPWKIINLFFTDHYFDNN